MNVEEKAAIKKRDKIKFIIYSDFAMYLGLSTKLSYRAFLKIWVVSWCISKSGQVKSAQQSSYGIFMITTFMFCEVKDSRVDCCTCHLIISTLRCATSNYIDGITPEKLSNVPSLKWLKYCLYCVKPSRSMDQLSGFRLNPTITVTFDTWKKYMVNWFKYFLFSQVNFIKDPFLKVQ